MPERGPVTLAQTLAYADDNAAAVVRARGLQARGRAERSAASLYRYDPVLELGLGARVQQGGVGLDAAIAVSQQVELGRRRRSRIEAAQRLQSALEAGLDAARWSVHAEVHLAYARALLAEDAAALARRRVELATTLRQMVETKIAAGDEPAMALEVARAELALAQSARVEADACVQTARLALAQAAGVSDRPLEPQRIAFGMALIDDPEGWVAKGRARNRELRRSKLELEAAQAQVEVAALERRPAPSVGIRYAHEGSTTRPGNVSPASDILLGTLSVSIPTFAGNRGALARRRAEVEVARSRHGAAQLEIDQATRIACVRVEAARRRVEQLRTDVVGGFDRAVEGIERAYALGERDFSAVAQSMGRLWAAREQVLAARGEYHTALADLELLVGPLEEARR